MLFQPFPVIGRPNHLMVECSLLNQCNHKARLNGSKACHLAWHPCWIVEVRLFLGDMIAFMENEIEPNNEGHIRLFIFQFLERFQKSGSDMGNRHP